MKVSIIEPSNVSHRVRGTGFYTQNLLKAFGKYFLKDIELVEEKSDADLVHYPFFEPFFLSLPLYETKKRAVTVHDLTPLVFPKEFPAGLRGKLKWTLQKLALKNCDAIITDSDNSKADIVRFTGINENKIHVVYLAAGEQFGKLEIGNWKSEITQKFGLPEYFALYVGDVTWNKNLPRLLEAVQKVKIPLVMAGEVLSSTDFDKNNPWNKDLIHVRQTIKQSNNGAIKALGFVGTKDLVALYNLATVFVMPSLYEGFGLPILEAMSCGCPVVTTKEGSIPEIAGDSAYFVDAYDVAAIAEGINKVFNDKNLQEELSKKGLAQARKFSWKKTAEQTLKVYQYVKKNN